MKISDIDELFEKCWKGYKKHGMKTMFGKRVPDCRKDESVNEDNPYTSQDIMHDDPPVGIDFDFNNLPKVDWSRYSKKDIKKFHDHLESLDFEDGFQLDGEYHGMYRSAADWVEKNVLSKRQDESVELDEDMPEMAPVYPNIKSGMNDAYGTIDEINYVIVRLQKTISEEYGDEYIPDEYQEPLDFIIDIMNKKLPSALRHITDIAKNDEVYESINEDLRAWFGKGKKGGAGGGGWDRYNTNGERVGKCGDSKKGEGKPKCLSKSRAASLRSSGGKKAIANAVKRKKANDPNANRKGKAKNVNSHPKK